jgi:hypothetical protein
MQLSEDNQEIELPEDIIPTFDDMCNADGDQHAHDQGISKKHKIWGPIQPVKQSKRTDRWKNVMEKAQELK